jgi:hypothetical protein
MRHRFSVESPRVRRTLLPALLAVSIAIPVLSHGTAAQEESAPVIISSQSRPFGPGPSSNPASESDTAPVIVADSGRGFGPGPAGSTAPASDTAPVIVADGGRTFGPGPGGARTEDGAATDGTDSREPVTDTTEANGEGKR